MSIYKRLLFIILSVSILPVHVYAANLSVNPGFNPSQIISDQIFADTSSFASPDGIQKFLVSKGSVLANTDPIFLSKLHEPESALMKSALDDPRPSLGRLRTAAELIYDAGASSGLNPQVILVILNKEQSLITGHQNSSPEKLQKALDRSMGFACPDSTGCGTLFNGFYAQIFGSFDTEGNRYLGAAKSLMKSYTLGRGPLLNGRSATVGDTILLDNTTGDYTDVPSQSVTIGNKATAALYRYTPHVYNGNYNFWKFYREWFKIANNALVQDSSGTLYMIQNGQKQMVPSFVATLRQLNLSTIMSGNSDELASYPTGSVLGPADNTLVKDSSGNYYIFIGDQKRPISDFVLATRGLSKITAISITDSDLAMFPVAGKALPPDGNMLRASNSSDVYIVDRGYIRRISDFVFKQRKLSQTDVKVVDPSEIALYPKSGYMAPLDGSYVKTKNSTAVYRIEEGLKQPLSASVLKTRKVPTKNISIISDEELAGIPIGAAGTPADDVVYKIGNGSDWYYFKDGSSHRLYAFVAKQKRFTLDITVTQAEHEQWSLGIPVAPKNGTAIKSSKSSLVYWVDKGQLRPMTSQAYKNRKLSTSKVTVVPQEAIDDFPKGDTLSK